MKRGIVSLLFASLATLITFITLCGNAHAQTAKPNIIFIMGDDIGWSNIGVYNQGIMAVGRQISTYWRQKARGSPTTMPKRVALPVARTSSPGNCRSARA